VRIKQIAMIRVAKDESISHQHSV